MHYFIVVLIAFALSIYGCEGKTGPAGPTGPSGSAGPAGPAGPQGSTGPQGATGAAGADGAQGPQGETGPMGPAGADGADGAPGPAGPQGEKGEQGEPGPAGPMGPAGPPGEDGEDGADGAPGTVDPAAIAGAIDGVVNSGILADVHHLILLKDGETDKTKGTRIDGPDFSDDVNINLLAGASTSYVAIAGSASGNPIPVTFSWETDVEDVASVDNGVISGHLKGKAVITMTVDGRGIVVDFNVTVHDGVKGIVASTMGATTIEKGDKITVTATAYDAAQDDMEGADGNMVPNITFTWMSSNTGVATVDGDGVVTAVGSGSADITAHVGGVTSNKISVSVYSVTEPRRQLVVDSRNQPYMIPATIDTSAAAKARKLTFGTPSDIDIILQEWGLKADGSAGWVAAANAVDVNFLSLNTDVLALGDEGLDVATATGEAPNLGIFGVARYTAELAQLMPLSDMVSADTTTGAQAKALLGDHMATVKVSSAFVAEDKYITVTVRITAQ